jgi:capsule polysaccharide export protein KpsE/RkpR
MSKPSGLTTLAIESKREEIAAAKAELAKLIRMRKDARIQIAAERAAAKELKAIDRAEKKAMRIAKLEAKLIALKSKPVGAKAIKMNKKPSKVTVLKMAA